MKRRDSIQRLMAISGGLAVLPTWAQAWDHGALTKEKLFGGEELSALSSAADTIIPGSADLPGALSVGVDTYLNQLFAECYESPVQENIKTFLGKLDSASGNIHGFQFSKGDQRQRQEILEAFSVSDDDSVRETFQLIKSETIRGFRTSQVVLTQYYNYKVAPGIYVGCADTEEHELN